MAEKYQNYLKQMYFFFDQFSLLYYVHVHDDITEEKLQCSLDLSYYVLHLTDFKKICQLLSQDLLQPGLNFGITYHIREQENMYFIKVEEVRNQKIQGIVVYLVRIFHA